MLVLQYGLGIILNLYVEVPASDAHAVITEIATAPLALTAHAILGIALMVRDPAGGQGRRRAGPAARGAGDGRADRHRRGVRRRGIFVRDGQDSASMAMAILTGMALLCYIGTLTLASAAGREDSGPRPVPVRAPVRAPVHPRSAPRCGPQCRPLCRRPGPPTGRTTRPSGPSPQAGLRDPGSCGSKRRPGVGPMIPAAPAG